MPPETEFPSASAEKPMQTADAVAIDVQTKLRDMARGYSAADSIKSVWNDLARSTGLDQGQVKRLYYGEWRVIPAHVFLRVNEAHREHIRLAAVRAKHALAVATLAADEWDRKWPNG